MLLLVLRARDRTQGLLDVCIEFVVALQRFPQVLLHIRRGTWAAMACTAEKGCLAKLHQKAF